MAEAICEGAKSAGAECEIVDAADFKDIESYDAIAVGSSTRMKRVLPMVKRVLSELPELKSMPAAGFGSYGWSGEAPDEIANKLAELGATLVAKAPLKVKDYPGEEALQQCRQLGEQLVEGCSD